LNGTPHKGGKLDEGLVLLYAPRDKDEVDVILRIVEAGIQYNLSNHGTDGPLHYSYPDYTFPLVGNWTPSLENIGISPNTDSSGGWGGYIATSSINPSNWTRSYSRSAYIDPLPPRSNLDILVNAAVTRIIFASNSSADNLTATAIEYASSSGAKVQTVNVTREVILAGGSIGSPQILMLSGVGPRDVLEAAGVAVQVELPGVGQHLQDHLSTGVTWTTGAETAGDVRTSGLSTATSPQFLSFVNSATAYANISTVLGGADSASLFQAQVLSALNSSASSLVPSQYPQVVAGYKAIYETVANTIIPSQVGQVELLLSLLGSSTVTIQAALQHPLSHGRVYINSPSVFDPAVIDPQYLSHSADLTIMREGLKLARTLGSVPPICNYLGTETSPGSSVSTDEEWDEWLIKQVGTEYHPTGTCAMLPESLGGVVNAKLQVYGLANVRVADASVYPLQFSSHLGAPTYGLAEKAADIIRSFYNAEVPSVTTTTSASVATDSGSSDTASSNAASPLKYQYGGFHPYYWTLSCAAIGLITGLVAV